MLQTGSDCGSGKVPARSFFIFATQSPTHSYMRLPRYSLKHIHQQKPFQMTNELAFSNDITGILASCVSFREYISRRSSSSRRFEFEYMRRPPNLAFIYKTRCKVDKYERSVFSFEILPHTSISPPTN